MTSLPKEKAACESVGERPDTSHCAVRVVCLALTDRRRNFGDLLVLSYVAGLLLGTLAAVPGCVAMLAHRNKPTTIVGYQFSPQAVRGSVAPRATVHRYFEREPFILFSFWSDPRFSPIVYHNHQSICVVW